MERVTRFGADPLGRLKGLLPVKPGGLALAALVAPGLAELATHPGEACSSVGDGAVAVILETGSGAGARQGVVADGDGLGQGAAEGEQQGQKILVHRVTSATSRSCRPLASSLF